MYDVGDRIVVRGTFTDDDGVLADPTTKALLYETEPSGAAGTIADGDITAVSTGIHEAEIAVTSAMDGKKLRWRWEAEGAIVAAGEDSTWIRRQRVDGS